MKGQDQKDSIRTTKIGMCKVFGEKNNSTDQNEKISGIIPMQH